MTNIWNNAQRAGGPFLVLAPMYDVTDLPFRKVVSECAPPDIFYTEFVSVDALNSPGRSRTLRHLDIKIENSQREESPGPLVVQIWGKQVENFTKASEELVSMGFDGIDINFGCPVNNVIKNDCCSGLQQLHLRDKALGIINATKAGIAGRVPLSLKTRTGFDQVDFSWHEFLLEQQPEALIVHGRTTKQLSKVPANWDDIKHIRELRDQISPETAMVGNGDVMDHAEATTRAQETGVDGVMIGRGIFHDPFAFAANSPWPDKSATERIALYIKHIEYHQEFLGGALTAPLKKFAKIYLNGFDGAKALRTRFMDCTTHDQMLDLLRSQCE